MKIKIFTSFLLFTFLISTIIGAIPSGNPIAQTTPTLYIENSQTIEANLQLTDITTLSQNTNTITDIISGYFNNETTQQLYAARYDNGLLTWAKSAFILNNQDFVNSSFNGLANNIFLGAVIGPQRQSSLIMAFNQTYGTPICQNVFTPVNTHWSSKLNNGIIDGSRGELIAVGTVNPDELAQRFSQYNLLMIVSIDVNNCNTINKILVGLVNGELLHISIINDTQSPYNEYRIVTGYTAKNNTVNSTILILDQNNTLIASKTISFQGNSYATSAAYLNNTIYVSGLKYNQDGTTDGYITALDNTLNTMWTMTIQLPYNDGITDITINPSSNITFTGFIGTSQSNTHAIAGIIDPITLQYTIYKYEGTSSKGYALTTSQPYYIHIVGTLTGHYPNTITEINQNILINTSNPTIQNYQLILKQYQPYYDDVELHIYSRFPIIDFQNYLATSGLYIVIGQESTPNPPPITTHTTITRTTNTTLTATITGQPTTTYTSIAKPSCIDISTGTNKFGQLDPYGTHEDSVNDYPDWIITNPTSLTPTVASLPPWTEFSGNARWITPYYNESSYYGPVDTGDSLISWPPTTYQITFTLQVPSTLHMAWTADNQGTLFIDGYAIQTNTNMSILANYTTGLPPGTHTITIEVVDEGYYTGLYVDGSICPPTPINSTVEPKPIPTTTTEPASTPCPCEDTITQIAGGVVALFTIGWILTYLLVRRK